MPIYEYRCRDCRTRSSILLLSYKEKAEPVCPACGSRHLTRIMSRFATVKSEDARLESLAEDPSLSDVNENDPASVARFMKKMGKEFGEDLGDDFESTANEAVGSERDVAAPSDPDAEG